MRGVRGGIRLDAWAIGGHFSQLASLQDAIARFHQPCVRTAWAWQADGNP